MKKNLRLILFALLATGVASCSKGDPEPNPTQISFTIALEGNPDVLHQLEKLSLESSNLHEITRVEFYAGDVLIAEDAEAPFEANWNTELLADGNYKLRVVAQASNNRKTENSKDVTISNLLFKAVIPPNYFGQDSDVWNYTTWIYLTDEQNNQIGAAQQVENGREYSWKRPKGYFSQPTLNIFRAQEAVVHTNRYYRQSSYTAYPYGEFSPEAKSVQSSLIRNLNLVNDSGASELKSTAYFGSNTYGLNIWSGVYSQQFAASVLSETEQILITQQPADPASNYFGEILYQFVRVPSEELYDVFASEGQHPSVTHINVPAGTEYAVSSSIWNIDGKYRDVQGYNNQDNTTAGYLRPANNEVSVPYVTAYVRNATGSFRILKPTTQMETTVTEPVHKVSATQVNETSYSIKPTGSADLYTAFWSSPYQSGARFYSFHYGAYTSTTIYKPVIPASILAAHEGLAEMPLSLQDVSSMDYINLNGYIQFFEELILPTYSFENFLAKTGGYTSNYTRTLTNTGERSSYFTKSTTGSSIKKEKTDQLSNLEDMLFGN